MLSPQRAHPLSGLRRWHVARNKHRWFLVRSVQELATSARDLPRGSLSHEVCIRYMTTSRMLAYPQTDTATFSAARRACGVNRVTRTTLTRSSGHARRRLPRYSGAPRTRGAIAQRHWCDCTTSGTATERSEFVRNPNTRYRYRMVQRGIRAIALQPHWCAVRPGLCDAGA